MEKAKLRHLCLGPHKPESYHQINVPSMTTYEYEWQEQFKAAKADFLGLLDEFESLSEWALSRWIAEVKDRPLQNIHRKTLDNTWRQIYRKLTGGKEIPYPTHEERLGLFNEFEFIKEPRTERDVGYWVCQDCEMQSNDPTTVIRFVRICGQCGSHTLGPFLNERECTKAYHAAKGNWGIFKRMQDEDGVVMPGFEKYLRGKIGEDDE